MHRLRRQLPVTRRWASRRRISPLVRYIPTANQREQIPLQSAIRRKLTDNIVANSFTFPEPNHQADHPIDHREYSDDGMQRQDTKTWRGKVSPPPSSVHSNNVRRKKGQHTRAWAWTANNFSPPSLTNRSDRSIKRGSNTEKPL